MKWIIAIIVIMVIIGSIMNSRDEDKEKTEAERKRQAAEDYIMNSGDKEAIKQLMLMKANPSSYLQQFSQSASSNSTMRTALGVFGGFIAADLVTSAIHQHQLQAALANFDSELAKIGGIENFTIADAHGVSSEIDVADAETDAEADDDFDLFS